MAAETTEGCQYYRVEFILHMPSVRMTQVALATSEQLEIVKGCRTRVVCTDCHDDRCARCYISSMFGLGVDYKGHSPIPCLAEVVREHIAPMQTLIVSVDEIIEAVKGDQERKRKRREEWRKKEEEEKEEEEKQATKRRCTGTKDDEGSDDTDREVEDGDDDDDDDGDDDGSEQEDH